MTGPLIAPAQAATVTEIVTQHHIDTAANADRIANSGWYHGLWAANTPTGDPSQGIEDVNLDAVAAAGADETKQNGSLEMTRTSTQLSRIEYPVVDANNPVADAPTIAEVLGTDAAATPRFQAYAPAGQTGNIGLGMGVFCNADLNQWGGTLTLLTNPTQEWKEYAWPVAGDSTTTVYSSKLGGNTTVAAFAAACPDARVAYVAVTGGRDVATTLYVDNVSFGGVEYDFAYAEGLFGGLLNGQEQLSTDGNYKLAMQSDGNLVLYAKNEAGTWAPTWNTGTTAGSGSELLVQDNGNVSVENAEHWQWQTNTYGVVNPDNREWVKLSIDSGDLEVVNQDGNVLWSSADDAGVYYPATLTTLNAGQSITSGTTTLGMQTDGNLVLYLDGAPVWYTGTNVPGSKVVAQPDGNIVIYNPNGDWLWQSNTYGNDGAETMVVDGVFALWGEGEDPLFDSTTDTGTRRYVQTVSSMASGAKASSLSTRYRFDMQADGNLVLWDLKATPTPKPIWNSGTWGHPGSYLVVQADGNLVVWDPVAKRAIWNTGTYGNPDPSLNLQDDGNLVLYSGTTPKWWTAK